MLSPRLDATAAAAALLFLMAAVGTTFHFVRCRRHGIDSWTAEPWDEYRRLRGWSA